MIESKSEKCLAQNESNIYVGVHVASSLTKVKDTHLMNNNQPVAEILCWRLMGALWVSHCRCLELAVINITRIGQWTCHWIYINQLHVSSSHPVFETWTSCQSTNDALSPAYHRTVSLTLYHQKLRSTKILSCLSHWNSIIIIFYKINISHVVSWHVEKYCEMITSKFPVEFIFCWWDGPVAGVTQVCLVVEWQLAN